MRKLHKQTGFTLAELLIVVAIIAILVAIGIPAFSTAMERSRETVDLSNIRGAYAEFMAGTLGGSANTGYYKVTIKQRDCKKWIIDTNGFLSNIVKSTKSGDTEIVTGYEAPTQMPSASEGLKPGEIWVRFSTKKPTGATTDVIDSEKPVLTFVAPAADGYPTDMPKTAYSSTTKTSGVVQPLKDDNSAPLTPTETDWYLTIE